MVLDRDESAKAYLNLQLSYRGSERQPPSILTLAVTFSHVMEEKNRSGEHSGELNTEQRLDLILKEFNDLPGMINKWKVCEEKKKACLNLMVGTSSDARALIQGHLNYHKWRDSAFTAELLRSTRWLLSSSPRNTKDKLKVLLTVDKDIQVSFLRNYIGWFSSNARKVKTSARGKIRPSVAEWDKLVDYTCVMQAVVKEIVSCIESEEGRERALELVEGAFMARWVNVKLLCFPRSFEQDLLNRPRPSGLGSQGVCLKGPVQNLLDTFETSSYVEGLVVNIRHVNIAIWIFTNSGIWILDTNNSSHKKQFIHWAGTTSKRSSLAWRWLYPTGISSTWAYGLRSFNPKPWTSKKWPKLMLKQLKKSPFKPSSKKPWARLRN